MEDRAHRGAVKSIWSNACKMLSQVSNNGNYHWLVKTVVCSVVVHQCTPMFVDYDCIWAPTARLSWRNLKHLGNEKSLVINQPAAKNNLKGGKKLYLKSMYSHWQTWYPPKGQLCSYLCSTCAWWAWGMGGHSFLRYNHLLAKDDILLWFPLENPITREL